MLGLVVAFFWHTLAAFIGFAYLSQDSCGWHLDACCFAFLKRLARRKKHESRKTTIKYDTGISERHQRLLNCGTI